MLDALIPATKALIGGNIAVLSLHYTRINKTIDCTINKIYFISRDLTIHDVMK